MDQRSYAEAFSGPGQDTRQWVSYGTVDEDTPDAPSVRFKDSEGAPLPAGPLVSVTLQPSGTSVVCRVASFIAGFGEGSWSPFLQKDEVLVVIPEGNEMAGPVIIGRMNQELDVWPATVAGQDATANKFGFWRLRTPFIIESAESFVIRSAKTGSQVGIDSTGQVIINNGDRNQLVIGSDVISLASGDGAAVIQIDVNAKSILLQADGTQWSIGPNETNFLTSGTINIGSGGLSGSGHAVTFEQMINMLNSLLLNIGIQIPGPILGANLAAQTPTILNAAIPFAAAPGTGTIAPYTATIAAAMLATLPPDPAGLLPGVARPNFLL